MNKQNVSVMEGSAAIAEAVRLAKPGVIAAYPITPQTHIVENLAKFKANTKVDFEYIITESEFSAASVVLGAAAGGQRAYTATSSQGLLYMMEVVYNIAGLRLPVVMTLANRAVSAPINIWNDQQDAMAVRDTGWIMLFAENNQEAVEMHLSAFRLAQETALPVMVNVDGFILTHTSEPTYIPTIKEVRGFLPPYKSNPETTLDPKHPKTIGHLVSPNDYQSFRKKIDHDISACKTLIKKIRTDYKNKINTPKEFANQGRDNGLFEIYGNISNKNYIVAMGSVAGTIKTYIDQNNADWSLLKLKTYRPFPAKELQKILNSKRISVLEKAISPGSLPPLSADLSTILPSEQITTFIAGLGGKDISLGTIDKLTKKPRQKINYL